MASAECRIVTPVMRAFRRCPPPQPPPPSVSRVASDLCGGGGEQGSLASARGSRAASERAAGEGGRSAACSAPRLFRVTAWAGAEKSASLNTFQAQAVLPQAQAPAAITTRRRSTARSPPAPPRELTVSPSGTRKQIVGNRSPAMLSSKSSSDGKTPTKIARPHVAHAHTS